MPRAKPDGKAVSVLRIELGTKERQLVESAILSYGLGQAGKLADGIGVDRMVESMSEAMKNPLTFVIWLECAAWLYEMVTGKDTLWPTPSDLFGVKEEMEQARQQREAEGVSGPAGGDFSMGAIIYNLLHPNWSWFEPPPG